MIQPLVYRAYMTFRKIKSHDSTCREHGGCGTTVMSFEATNSSTGNAK